MKKLLLVLGGVFTLEGCVNNSGAYMTLYSAHAPVIAILSDDLFVGTAIGYMDRTGTINITSALNPDLKCLGHFKYTGSQIGEGSMTCNDGTEARIQFNKLTNLSGYGLGTSTRGGISFTYGLTPEEATKYLSIPTNKRLRPPSSSNEKLQLI